MSAAAQHTPEQLNAYKETAEYKEILSRHQKLVASKEIAILEINPAFDKVFGSVGVVGYVNDKYGNLVFKPGETLWVAPMGSILRFDKVEDLKGIYAFYNCPIYRGKCVLKGETPKKHEHRYILNDAEKESSDYCAKRERDMEYCNKFYQHIEGTIDLLCSIASIPTSSSLPIKRANLCKAWESGGAIQDKLKKMMDSPDIEYYEVANLALKEGNASDNKGFYKTQNGVYKCNDEILGNSIDHVVSYLKTHDEVFFAFKKSNEKAVAKPK